MNVELSGVLKFFKAYLLWVGRILHYGGGFVKGEIENIFGFMNPLVFLMKRKKQVR
jgi:hypothetical protein